MKTPTGEQHTLIQKIRRYLPHTSVDVITEVVCGVDTQVISGLSENSPVADLQLAYHNAPEGTQEQALIVAMYEASAEQRFIDRLHHQHILKPDNNLDLYLVALRDLLHAAPPHSQIRRRIVREIMEVYKDMALEGEEVVWQI